MKLEAHARQALANSARSYNKLGTVGRLYPILAVLWASLFALFLAVWSEWLKGPHALETVQKILSSNLRWLGAALVVFAVATLWSYFKSSGLALRLHVSAAWRFLLIRGAPGLSFGLRPMVTYIRPPKRRRDSLSPR